MTVIQRSKHRKPSGQMPYNFFVLFTSYSVDGLGGMKEEIELVNKTKQYF